MADNFSPNPYSVFDPSQWSNPYSRYQNQALPWPTQYAGAPTDAFGRPIASYQNAPAGADMSQAYLQALANPGPVMTPGASGPPGPIYQGQQAAPAAAGGGYIPGRPSAPAAAPPGMTLNSGPMTTQDWQSQLIQNPAQFTPQVRAKIMGLGAQTPEGYQKVMQQTGMMPNLLTRSAAPM